jgi:DtxR family Mn-dependent transcriptional regulator
MEEGYHTPIEEYLGTIFTLGDEGPEVIGARIAERLERSAPAVKEMLDRLEEDGYIVRDGRTVALTDKGLEIAVTVTRRHRLAECLLVDVIGLEWYKVHDEAGRWEHVISPDVEAKLVQLLGDPATCPHGNPIPGSRHAAPRAEQLLSEVAEGDEVLLLRLAEMVERFEATLRQLDEAGFVPGATGVISARGSDGSLTVTTERGRVVVTPELADRLFVAASLHPLRASGS